ncbi:nucleolar RNA helicase 2-like [Tachyglossus aculeatus]|uniref:nucleolar RNA helicase 2-like n=1 Tax=Tachyglossus aculeatus TaxID=9261 RepID=UPI0018F5527F|nr:nucleolar RNA helicase 2-like [Tachyglossus aculeatus]
MDRAAMDQARDPTSGSQKKGKKEKKPKQNKPKKLQAETEVSEELSPPALKKVKKKEEPSEGECGPPKSKKAKKKEEPSEDALSTPKPKKAKKKEEVSENELDSPKPKKARKKGKDLEEKSPTQKSSTDYGVAPSSPVSQAPNVADEPQQDLTAEQKEGAFSNFSISQETIQLLKARGVTYLFPIQAKTFGHVSSGKDVIAQARTGTGKTFSFAIPLIEKLQRDLKDRKRGRLPKVLILTPTRELAIQVARDFSDITKKLTVACFYGGTAYNGQIDHIRNGIDILVGTPGRIRDHIQSGRLNLTSLQHVVLDEVDQMLDMGFAEQVEEILGVAYKKDSEDNPQTLLFSATCPHWVYDVAKKYMKVNYEQVDLIGKKAQKTAMTVEHLAIKCHWSQRAAVIGTVIQVYSGTHGRTIVFCRTKKEATELSVDAAIKQDAQSLHGDIPQKQREITLKGFRSGVFGVLVATNVAARGLDIPEVDLVIQSSPPEDVESYIHRSGRTGRAGRTGICVCFYQAKEEYQLSQVEQKAGITFKRIGVPSTTEIVRASSKDVLRSLDSIPLHAIDYFKQPARELIEEKGAVDALAAAIAVIAGVTSVEQRSLLNAAAGYVTMTLQCSMELHTISYAWRSLKEQLGEDIDDKVNHICLLKGRMGVCFDVPQAAVQFIKEQWQDTRRWQLSVATELPELEEPYRDGGRGGRGRGGGRGGGRGRGSFSNNFRNRERSGGGGFNRNDRFPNRGQKRSFSRAFDQ